MNLEYGRQMDKDTLSITSVFTFPIKDDQHPSIVNAILKHEMDDGFLKTFFTDYSFNIVKNDIQSSFITFGNIFTIDNVPFRGVRNTIVSTGYFLLLHNSEKYVQICKKPTKEPYKKLSNDLVHAFIREGKSSYGKLLSDCTKFIMNTPVSESDYLDIRNKLFKEFDLGLYNSDKSLLICYDKQNSPKVSVIDKYADPKEILVTYYDISNSK